MILEDYLRAGRERVEVRLAALLPPAEGPAATVARAMRYAALDGGKRLRPILVLAVCEACGGDAELALSPAAAVEMLHCYSLVHDDLPAMDDDDLRRGRPTVHRAFGEAEAILAGDALLTLALEILAREPEGEAFAARRCAAATAVARAAGIAGMVGGQIADLEAEQRAIDAPTLEWIHRHKTGALLAAAAEVGAIHAGADPSTCAALSRFGAALGVAFQVADDILDVTATAEIIGKTPGKDRRSGKATYPSLLGIHGSRGEAERLVSQSLLALRGHVAQGQVLEALARYAVDRTH